MCHLLHFMLSESPTVPWSLQSTAEWLGDCVHDCECVYITVYMSVARIKFLTVDNLTHQVIHFYLFL